MTGLVFKISRAAARVGAGGFDSHVPPPDGSGAEGGREQKGRFGLDVDLHDEEKATGVAIQGERGSFSEQASVQMVPGPVEFLCCRTFDDVFLRTAQGECGCCVIPIENSLAGSIHRNYDLLVRHGLKIRQETNLPVEHSLITLAGGTFGDVKTVRSHPVALDQCELFFKRYPHLVRETGYDTSGSVKEIVEGGLREHAAIAGKNAAWFYGAKVLMERIEDREENFTRFFLLSDESSVSEAADKTSIVFSFKNAAGALFKCLSVFALRDIDLTKIESRPIHGRPWEYLFYLDFLGNTGEARVRNALSHLGELTEFLTVLGCYLRDATHEKKGM